MRKFYRFIKDMMQSTTQIADLEVDEFLQQYENVNNAILLDVRSPKETSKGIIEGATIINYMDNSFGSKIKELDKSKSYYIYCRSGRRSMNACIAMQEIGIQKVANSKGGYLAYLKLNNNIKRK